MLGRALGVWALGVFWVEFFKTIVGLILAESGDEASDDRSYSWVEYFLIYLGLGVEGWLSMRLIFFCLIYY